MLTDCKAIVSGNTVELYRFLSSPLEYGTRQKRDKVVGEIYTDPATNHQFRAYKDQQGNLWERQVRNKEITQEDQDRYLRDSIRRAATNIRRLSSANHGQYMEGPVPFRTKFLTLTFQDPSLTFLEQTNPYFAVFTRNLNRKLFARDERLLRYLAVPERQERGTIHYHALLFNMPFIEQRVLQDLWESGLPEVQAEHGYKGIVDIRATDSPKVVFYLTKYLVKNFADPTLEHKRKYFPSVNLLRPTVVYDSATAQGIASFLPKNLMTFTKTYTSFRNGLVEYSSFTTPQNFLTSLTGGTFAQL